MFGWFWCFLFPVFCWLSVVLFRFRWVCFVGLFGYLRVTFAFGFVVCMMFVLGVVLVFFGFWFACFWVLPIISVASVFRLFPCFLGFAILAFALCDFGCL